MASRILQVADGVVAALNGAAAAGTFARRFAAERRYDVTEELAAGVELAVPVVPAAIEYPLADRRTFDKRVSVHVAVQQRLRRGTNPRDPAANAAIDPLMALAEEVADFWTPGRRADGSVEAYLVEKTAPAIWLPEHLKACNTLTSVFTLTFHTGN